MLPPTRPTDCLMVEPAHPRRNPAARAGASREDTSERQRQSCRSVTEHGTPEPNRPGVRRVDASSPFRYASRP